MGLFELRRKQHSVELTLKFKRVVLFDQITEFSPVHMLPGDSLQINWNVEMQARVDGVETDRMEWKSQETFHCTTRQVMRFARYSYLNGKSLVRVYDELPELSELPAE
jgi:hypothetical protein